MMESRYEEIYRRYTNRSVSFEATLCLIEELLTYRLVPCIRRIWVQGNNSGRTRLMFTVFIEGESYQMLFSEIGSLRQFRPNGDLQSEIVLIENLIETFRTGVLRDFIT